MTLPWKAKTINVFINFIDKSTGLVHWEDPEESGGEGGGRGDWDGEYM